VIKWRVVRSALFSCIVQISGPEGFSNGWRFRQARPRSRDPPRNVPRVGMAGMFGSDHPQNERGHRFRWGRALTVSVKRGLNLGKPDTSGYASHMKISWRACPRQEATPATTSPGSRRGVTYRVSNRSRRSSTCRNYALPYPRWPRPPAVGRGQSDMVHAALSARARFKRPPLNGVMTAPTGGSRGESGVERVEVKDVSLARVDESGRFVPAGRRRAERRAPDHLR